MNFKGGSGKTTTAGTLARLLSRQGHPVLAIVNTETGDRVREIPFPDLGEILNPTQELDRYIAYAVETMPPFLTMAARMLLARNFQRRRA